MSWQPQNLGDTCSNTVVDLNDLTVCQASTFVFLQMITSLFRKPITEDTEQYHDNRNSFKDYGRSQYSNEEYVQQQNSEYNYGRQQGASEFDFIVVGAGTSGCVVANRLSEIPEWNVLLLEAGIEEPEVADIPGFATSLRRSIIDWGFRTQPQKTNCRMRRQGRCAWARGRVMGGSSSINYMIYLRGGPRDYDDWETLGNPGWSYRDVLPYFLKSEGNQNLHHTNSEHNPTVSPKYHSTDGEWTVQYFPYQDPNVYQMINAFRELGLEQFDQNMRPQIGTSLIQHANRHGVRLSANRAFILPIRNKRPNLTVMSSTYVTRVLIDPFTKKAYGVEYLRNRKLRQVYARKEVILSTGVMQSPKLLMLSGVGPRNHLLSRNIRPILDLPGVGRNLHDHTTTDGLIIALNNQSSTLVDPQMRESDINYYVAHHDGPLASTGTLQVNGFIRSSFERDPDRADLQYSIDATNYNDFFNDPIVTAEANVLPLVYYNALVIRPVLLTPRSRGYILLNNTDPVYGDPLIYPNTFTVPEDLYTMLEAVKIGVDLAMTESVRRIGQLVTNELPGCDQHKFGTDEYFICLMMSYTTTLYHPVGTCKMGPKSDSTAVVSPQLKVYGIKNLRVIDASIIPITTRANTNTPCLMIGEKGSDLIKEEWLYKKKTKEQNFGNIFKNFVSFLSSKKYLDY